MEGRFKKLKTKCECGCGDFQVECLTCGFISGFRHRFNHVCITESKIVEVREDENQVY